MSGTHEHRIEQAFTKQARTFERADLNVAFTSGLPWLVGLAMPAPDDRALDVAGGTGLVARALAPKVASVTVLDATEAMLVAGRGGVNEEGLDNVTFARGEAAALPFGEAAFTLVTTRFSLHHFSDPAPMLDEMARVTAPGGRLVVMDLVASTDEKLAARQDHIERLRDDSHVSMPVAGVVRGWLESRDCQVERVAQRSFDRPLEPWLEQSVTPSGPAQQARSLLQAEIEGGPETGMRPHVEDGALWFRQTWETTVARRS